MENRRDDGLVGSLTWSGVHFVDELEVSRKKNRVIGMTFPRSDANLGLEPSILTVLPPGENVEHCMTNQDFNDADVQLYLCSVYISGLDEFIEWAMRHDKSKIVAGGYHPTTFPEDFERYVFKIVQGPCDDIWQTIQQEGQVVLGVVTDQHLPRRDLYDIGFNQQIIPDKQPDDVVVSINTSVGCNTTPPCDFCCSPIMCKRIFPRPLHFVEAEARALVQYEPKFCFFRDENFTMQKDWRDRLRIIHSHLPNTRFYLFASANTLNLEKAQFMKDHGVYMICLGLEDPTASYGKNKKLDQVVRALKQVGIMVYLSFIVNPLNIIGVQPAKDFYDILLKRIEELAPEMICGNFLMPFRGTKLWDEYYAYVDRDDYKNFDSKTPFLIRNRVIREKMKFFLFWYQWKYYTSDFYRENVRDFRVNDTLHLRFEELNVQFVKLYERIWNIRA